MRPRNDTQRVARLAARQHGNVSYGQLVERGLSHAQIRQRVAAGWLIPRHADVYAVGHVPQTRESRWMAATLAVGMDAVLSHRAAAAHWEILRGPVPTEVTVPTYAGHDHRDGILVHRCALPPHHMETRDGIPVTSLLLTVFDIAAVEPRRLDRVFEQAQVRYHLDPVIAAAEAECRRGYRGTGRIRRLLAGAVDPAAVRSVLELRFLELCQAYEIPRPLVNESLGRWSLDFWWPAQRLAVETDSAAFHSSLAATRRDRLKDEDVAALAINLIRLRWRDVVEAPAPTAAQVLTALDAVSVT